MCVCVCVHPLGQDLLLLRVMVGGSGHYSGSTGHFKRFQVLSLCVLSMLLSGAVHEGRRACQLHHDSTGVCYGVMEWKPGNRLRHT